MSQNDTSTSNTPSAQYSLGYSDSIHQWMSQRTAATNAAFLLPYLHSGMRLLDCGCGPGSITIGLANAIAPGEDVGIDIEIEPEVTDTAKELHQKNPFKIYWAISGGGGETANEQYEILW